MGSSLVPLSPRVDDASLTYTHPAAPKSARPTCYTRDKE
jgi:hypothetical protein